uniref:Goosefish kalliklectin n=1 Tax=Lophiomus setigerus TaxID=292417 RepID=B3XXB9_LOPSE|nr:goosefish kalliklectin [Lophiomus setigerus]
MEKRGTYLILVGLLSVCSISFAQECIPQLVKDMDFPGSDIENVFAPDAEHCQKLCTEHPKCLFFTFVEPEWTRDSRNYYCYLKYTSTGKPNSQVVVVDATAGYSLKPSCPKQKSCVSKVYEDVDFNGADYESLFVDNQNECQKVCTNDPFCQFFTFVNEGYKQQNIRNKCHLKFSWTVPIIPVVVANPGVISGFSCNAKMSPACGEVCKSELFPDTDIPGSDLLALPAASSQHCQALCSAHPKCTFFSFDSNAFKCYLKNNPDYLEKTKKAGWTSGLPARNCQMDKKWLMIQYDGVDFRGSDIRYVEMDDPDTCQKTCDEDSNCQFYTYVRNSSTAVVHRRRCYLKRVITMPAPPRVSKLTNVVSGFSRRNCI